ncbi:GDP-mannose 4,6-dehydratase [Candidatus Woesearchaeota archaeon]|nr:GDP-mannose 4,6-dehydratase [Candidatus Woesearchaeota archaeon]
MECIRALEGKILVTGGAGFIGSHVVDALLARGREVVVVDNFNDYYDPRRKRRNIASHLDDKAFTLAEGSIEDFSFLQKVFERYKPHKVLHLAARAGVRPSIQDPLLYKVSNVDGTQNILELARRNALGQFVFASSSSVYGGNIKIPFSEEDRVDQPFSPYAATKRMGELLGYTYSHLFELPVTCLRFFTVYGPRGRPDMAPYLFTDAISNGRPIEMFGDGSTRRDYTYISDIVSGVLASLEKPFAYEIFNLGNSQTVSLRDFISTVEDVVGKEAIIQQRNLFPGDVPVTFADISKAKKMLGYSPVVPVKDGLRHFFEWYSRNSMLESD